MEKLLPNLSHKIAFYPCCADDIEQPRSILKSYVDEIIFCDLKKPRSWSKQIQGNVLPKIRFIKGDVREILFQLPPIHLFFYRRDGVGEGGSGIYLLNKKWIPKIMNVFSPNNGFIITDGSNTGDGIFRKMIRPNGYKKEDWNWMLKPSHNQDLLERYNLHKIEVERF